ncbi:NADPH-dependent FMN reductase [Pedobacter cryotolerans]|uniref:NAD(P)H-dependent oxidoreductase n=1 Tax=Pedobacter cryotolerans TaxID=2571270 RepID=A0A4U1BX38_9SPHI|nr:NAD(P)H-dependent oxidoreductase [Pedobacter cryotolerans]TKB97218.1 NAD(P)H-dependent oxidoreductase [Pedobacter cryotolerans]
MVTIISGTNRLQSNTLKVAKYYQQKLNDKGLATQLINLQDLPANLIESDLYGKRSEEFQKFQDIVTKTTKFLFVIPEYNGSFPGVLKTFIDACSFPESFYDKKACLVGISSGKYGNIRGIEHFNGVCAYLHLNVMPLRIHISNIKTELDENDQLIKEDTFKFVGQQIEKFVAY